MTVDRFSAITFGRVIKLLLLMSYSCSSIYDKRTSRYASASSIDEPFYFNAIKDQSIGRSLINQKKCPNWCRIGNNCKSKKKCRSKACEYQCTGSCKLVHQFQSQSRTASASIVLKNAPNRRCDPWCGNEAASDYKEQCAWIPCNGCAHCAICPLGTFIDVTKNKLPSTDPYFHQWTHSGRPYSHEGAPLFVDVNGDNRLDYFNSMHAHGLSSEGYKDRFELGESVPFDFHEDGVDPPPDASNPKIQRYRRASYRIIVTDNDEEGMDPHGQNIVDLDGDGILDLMISSGGSLGAATSLAQELSRDNFLFWGELGTDEITGEETTIFKGGRDTARKAGVHMRNGRGRFNYMLDVNGDGLLDIFCIQDRRVSDDLSPGILLINQGDRTWKEEPSMSEYTRSMLVTDVDGDGLAQEIMISRGFCFPQRDGPGGISRYAPALGPFSKEVLDFCSTRPVGTTVVYKYNADTSKMDEITSPYRNISANKHRQPPCCPHGSWSGSNDCHAKSIVSGDFDGDLVADHIFLYGTKMEFYFSSDRHDGSLPDDKSKIGAEFYFPEKCKGEAESIRMVDLDNDGTEEIIVMCRQVATFLVYTKGDCKQCWSLDNSCNHEFNLGDISDKSLAELTEQDLLDSCKYENKWNNLDKICDYSNSRHGSEKPETINAGFSVVDINNDGFMDMVVNYNFGYTRFYQNVPSEDSIQNRHISLKLIGIQGISNEYGIGATVILWSRRSNDLSHEFVKQFKEISSYVHSSDKYGNNDPRIIFGLGPDREVHKVVVKWPNGDIQETWLQYWKYTGYNSPVLIYHRYEK